VKRVSEGRKHGDGNGKGAEEIRVIRVKLFSQLCSELFIDFGDFFFLVSANFHNSLVPAKRDLKHNKGFLLETCFDTQVNWT
jgi:hypothetical protein